MKRSCQWTGREFELREQELDFYEKMDVPVPDIHPDEILRSLMACRNGWNLYRRSCDKTGKPIISAYHEDVPFPVYDNEVWWGDSWDGLEYGRAFTPERSFFEQFFALRDQVPREGTSVFNSENCAYNGHVRESKNCYLCFGTYRVENCLYCSWVMYDQDLVDCHFMDKCELCYECMYCVGCFDCVMVQASSHCNECYFSYQLRGCDHCIGCSNLERKSYYVFNKPVKPAEFEKLKKEIFNGSYQTWQQGKQYFQKMWDKALHRYVHSLNCENCEGDELVNCKNIWHGFEGWNSEDCAYSASFDQSKDVWHSYSTGWPACSLVHSSSITRGSQDIRFCYYTWFSSNLTYCDSCVSCRDCFGCVGLKHKQYCILNKQYTKEEYFVLRDRIIEHMRQTPLGPPLSGGKEIMEWGRFPPGMSTFAYNETVAQEYWPLTKREALARGYRWLDDPGVETPCQGVSTDIPDSIHDTDDSICRETLHCAQMGKPYKVQKEELKFYRRMGLPIPRLSPEARRELRNQRRNPYQLFPRQCVVCEADVLSSFAPHRRENIGCETCYLQSIQ